MIISAMDGFFAWGKSDDLTMAQRDAGSRSHPLHQGRTMAHSLRELRRANNALICRPIPPSSTFSYRSVCPKPNEPRQMQCQNCEIRTLCPKGAAIQPFGSKPAKPKSLIRRSLNLAEDQGHTTSPGSSTATLKPSSMIFFPVPTPQPASRPWPEISGYQRKTPCSCDRKSQRSRPNLR